MTNPQPEEKDLPRYYQSESYISHSNKSQGIIDRIYKIARSYTLKWKYHLVQKHSLHHPSSLLDYGCGTGAFLQHCQTRNLHVAGVEPSDLARAEAIRMINAPVVSHLHEAKGQYDAITLWHVLEHVSTLNTTIEELKSKLQNNGTMFIAVPNLNSRDAKKYRQYWAAYDVPRHLWHFTKHSMESILNGHGLKLNKVLPMRLDAYYVSMLSEKYKRGQNNISTMTRALISGWQTNIEAKKTNEYSSLIYIIRK